MPVCYHRAVLARNSVDREKAGIVRCELILNARIPQTNHQHFA